MKKTSHLDAGADARLVQKRQEDDRLLTAMLNADKRHGRGNPDGPPTRGRKGHSSIDAQPGFRIWLEEKLLENPDMTYDELHELMKSTGFYASRSAVARFGLKFERTCAELQLLILQAKIIANEDAEETLALEKASSRLAMKRLFEHLVKGTTPSDGDVALFKSIAVLQSSAASRERAVTIANGKMSAAIQLFTTLFTEQVKNDPAILKRFRAVLKKAFPGIKVDE